jgi:hypothetical protein
MMRNQTCRLFLLLIPPLFLLFPFAALVTILERISKNALFSHLQRDMRNGAFEITLQGHTTTQDVTLDINSGPTYTILGTCVIGYFIAALGTAGIWQLRRVEGTAGNDRMWTWIVFLSNTTMIAAALGSFGYASSVQASDKGWRSVEDVGKDGGEHTQETWACQIQQLDPNQHWAGTACGTAKAMRFCLLALAVAALLVFVSLWVLVRARGGLKWVFGGKGRYAGFQNVYEMQPSPYVGLPPMGGQSVQSGPQWVPQPGQQYMPQPYQQWGPPPVQQWEQPVQQWSAPPVQYHGLQPAVQVPKSDVTVEQRPVP